MFWEYVRLSGLTGNTLFSAEFIQRAGLLVGSGILLILVGFKLKGTKGAVLALLVGAALVLLMQS